MSEQIGENTFLKLRQQKDQMKAELEQVKIQRDIALRRQKKLEDAVKDLRKLVAVSYTHLTLPTNREV